MLYRGATTTQGARIDIPKDTKLTILRKCSSFYYVDIDTSFEVDDFFKTQTGFIAKVDITIPVSKVTLDKSSLSLYIGDTDTLSETVYPDLADNKQVTWTSSNSDVATVSSSGKVSAKDIGSTTITVTTTDGQKTATCEVEVTPIPVSTIKLDKTKITLQVPETFTLKATVSPSDADNKNITFTSDNSQVAKVDLKGKVTAVSVGKATITATTEDGEKTATCEIEVKPIPVTKVTLNNSSLSIFIGRTATLKATISPANATTKSVTWKSSNTKVATVDKSGKVVTKGVGKATITVTTTDGSKTAKCTLEVKPILVSGVKLNKTNISVMEGQAFTLVATVSPSNATNKAVTFKSSNTKAATIDQTGKVTAQKVGSATITVTTTDGKKVAMCSVMVKPVPVASVKLNETMLPMSVGQSETLVATVLPTNATNKAVTWKSSNPTVVSVSPAGVLNALKVGAVTITVTTRDGAKKATCKVVADNDYSSASSSSLKRITTKLVETARLSNGKFRNTFSFVGIPNANYYMINKRISGQNKVLESKKLVGGRTYKDSNAGNKNVYTYWVIAYDKNHNRIGTGSITITTGQTTLTAEAISYSDIKLSWTRIPRATGYLIYRSTDRDVDPKAYKNVSSKTTSFTDKRLKAKTTYYYTVAAICKTSSKTIVFAKSIKRSATPTIVVATRKCFEGLAKEKVVKLGKGASSTKLINDMRVNTVDQGNIKPPIKYYVDIGAKVTLEIHIYANFLYQKDAKSGIKRSNDTSAIIKFKKGVEKYFHNKKIKKAGVYEYTTKVFWHKDSVGQRNINVFIGGVATRGGYLTQYSVEGDYWYHAYGGQPLGAQKSGSKDMSPVIFMPTDKQVESNIVLGHQVPQPFGNVAAHEMGHIFGLGDGYYDINRSGDRMTENSETCFVDGSFFYNIMLDANDIDKALPNDFEMILRAYANNVKSKYGGYEYYKDHYDYVKVEISEEIDNKKDYVISYPNQ